MWNILVEQAVKKVGGYAYVFPTYSQGKKAIWDAIDKNGLKFRDHIPKEILVSTNEQELKITLLNGSFIQILGSDNEDGLVGTAFAGMVFSEFAMQNPTIWDKMRPILLENKGWALFNSTPRGKNHFYDMFNMAKDNEQWFCERLTAEDTKDEDGNRIVTEQDIEDERKSGMSEEMVQQEYFCSFDVGAIGSYYGTEMEEAREDGRITKLPFSKDVPVDLYFDLGVNDNFTISFKQNDGQFFNFVNYYQDNGKTLDFYFRYIDEWIMEKKAKLGLIYLPHDSKQKAHSYLVSGITIYEKFEAKYPGRIRFIKNDVGVNDGIQETRKLFPRIRFDADNCVELIRCMDNYKKDWDDVKKIFRDKPCHDWASHGADNMRYFGVSDKGENKRKKQRVFAPKYAGIN